VKKTFFEWHFLIKCHSWKRWKEVLPWCSSGRRRHESSLWFQDITLACYSFCIWIRVAHVLIAFKGPLWIAYYFTFYGEFTGSWFEIDFLTPSLQRATIQEREYCHKKSFFFIFPLTSNIAKSRMLTFLALLHNIHNAKRWKIHSAKPNFPS
jgi:hypothetical protein